MSLFVGVEAKVDENFGKTVSSTYLSAMKKRNGGTNTNAPERVKNLLSKYFSCEDPPESSRFAGIRYQLLTGCAGTVAREAEIAVFYILVFRTAAYDERKSLTNQQDYGEVHRSCRRETANQGRRHHSCRRTHPRREEFGLRLRPGGVMISHRWMDPHTRQTGSTKGRRDGPAS